MSLAIFIRWATREIKALWQRIEKIDVQQKTAPQSIYTILIKDGNELDTGQLGVLYEGAGVTEVPSAYDPDVTSSFVDGIGRGTLYRNGVAQDGYVLVVNDSRSSFGHALLGDNADDDGPDLTWGFGEVSIPVAGGGAVRAWVVG